MTDACVITSYFAGVQLEVVNLTAEQLGEKDLIAKNPTKKFPFLETPEGNLFESSAICRHLARVAGDKGLYGSNPYENAQVDQWIDFSNSTLLNHIHPVMHAVAGRTALDGETYNKHLTEFKSGLRLIHNALDKKEFLVGSKITIADILIACHIMYPM